MLRRGGGGRASINLDAREGGRRLRAGWARAATEYQFFEIIKFSLHFSLGIGGEVRALPVVGESGTLCFKSIHFMRKKFVPFCQEKCDNWTHLLAM